MYNDSLLEGLEQKGDEGKDKLQSSLMSNSLGN